MELQQVAQGNHLNALSVCLKLDEEGVTPVCMATIIGSIADLKIGNCFIL
jgi:hypothetical protein